MTRVHRPTRGLRLRNPCSISEGKAMNGRLRARVKRIRARLRLTRLARSERGIQLAELALVLPLFLILFATTAEFGRFFYEYSTLAKATRAGTRYLVSTGVSADEDLRAKNIVVYGNP